MIFGQKNKRQEAGAGTAAAEGGLSWKGYLFYYAAYTALFCVTAAAVFVWFFLKKRRLVWQTDGVNQHYYGLVYFSRWGKEVLRNFRETGSLRFPTFSLRMGYGGDLYTTLAYYVIGDPFSLPAVFVPEKYLLLFHDLMLLTRFWLAGMAFSAYNFFMGRKNRMGVLAGALVYIFNGFTMSGMRHHYFLNPFVFFPLLLIGCELYLRKKKPWLFLVMVFVTAVSNFYFFYMMVIMAALYAVWRSVRIHGFSHFGGVILDGISFVWYGLIGTLLSSFLLLPILLRFLQDPRTADSKQIPLLWPLWYYRNFIDCFLSNGTTALAESWTYMGFGAVALLCVLFVFLQGKKHFDLKAAFIGLTLLLMTPLTAYAMNGFSYPANRWMWAYALLIGTMTAAAVPELAEAGGRKIAAGLLLFAAVILVCVCWKYTFSRSSAQSVILGLLAMAAVLIGRILLLERERKELSQELSRGPKAAAEKPAGAQNPGGEERAKGQAADVKPRGAEPQGAEKTPDSPGLNTAGWQKRISLCVQAGILLCVMLSITAAAYFDFAPDRAGKVLDYLSRAQIETAAAKDARAASELIDGQLLRAEADESGRVPFYRYTTYNPENNTSLLYGVSNTQYYWSLSDPSVSQFLDETGQLNRLIHLYDTLDDRTFLNEIAGIRYFLGNDADGVPYGYEKKEGLAYQNHDLWPDSEDLERFSCEVYENKYALPFGFTTDRWIGRQDYDRMDIAQRQQALMQGILLEKDPGEGFTQMKPAATQTAGAAAGNRLVFTDTELPYQIEYRGESVPAESLGKISFASAGSGETVRIRFAGMQDCETALYIHGLQYISPTGENRTTKPEISVTGYAGGKAVASKQIGYTTAEDPWTTGRRDFYVNMRWQNQPLDHFDLVLEDPGTYSIDSMEVVCQPMTGYAEQAEVLRTSPLTDLDIHEMGNSFATDRITGHIDLPSPQILCLQIPPSAGWSAYLDGSRVELLQADTMFSAILVPAGSHDIELRYQTPGLRFGTAISLGALVLLVLFLVIYSIVSAILRGRDRKIAAIPVGTYEPAENVLNTAEAKAGEKEGAPGSPDAKAGETEGAPGSPQAPAAGPAEKEDSGQQKAQDEEPESKS